MATPPLFVRGRPIPLLQEVLFATGHSELDDIPTVIGVVTDYWFRKNVADVTTIVDEDATHREGLAPHFRRLGIVPQGTRAQDVNVTRSLHLLACEMIRQAALPA